MPVKFSEYVMSGTPLICVRTHEEGRVIKALINECQNEGLIAKHWDVITGGDFGTTDPIDFLEQVQKKGLDAQLVFVKDIHTMLDSPESIRATKIAIEFLKDLPASLVLIAPEFKIPTELEKSVIMFDFSLPTVQELKQAAENIIEENDLKDIELDDKVFTAARGLTMPEAENAFSLSLIKYGTLDRDLVLAEKLQAIRKSGLMEIYEPESEDNVGGLKELKRYLHTRKKGFNNPDLPKPNGILMVGPPGAGKSLSAKMVSSIYDMPLLRLDFSSLKSKYVGDSEARVKQVLQLIDAVAPCVVWLDRFCPTKIV